MPPKDELKEPITPLDNLMIECSRNTETLENICEVLKDIKRTIMQLFGGMIGIVMAQIGQKLISTPWYVDVAVILALIAGGMLSTSLVLWWKVLSWAQRTVRILSSGLMVASSITQIWIYRPGLEPAPTWFPVVTNGFLIFLALALIWVGVTQIPKGAK
jgi:hypothetical protein